MELLEADDPIKGKLLEKTSRHRDELEDEVNLLSERTEKIVTNALIIGGALALTYFMVRQFSRSKGKKKKKIVVKPVKTVAAADTAEVEEEEEESTNPLVNSITQIGTAVASQATMFLLEMAKEKLGEYLQSQSQKKES